MGALALRIERDTAILEFDRQDSKVNVLNTGSMLEFSRAIDSLKGRPGIKALIITSKKEGVFIAGADIKEIEGITSQAEAKEKAEKGKEVLSKLEGLELVTVAAINGACLGGGFELALACKYRTAAFGGKVRIGLPEVNLGLLPGWGGTQRLPRLIGLSRALTMILSGRIISGREALKYGAVDRLFPEACLLDETVAFARALSDGSVKVKRKKRKKLAQAFLENTSLGKRIVFSRAEKNVIKKTKGFYPAPLKALDVIRRTCGGNIKKGLSAESQAFCELAVTQVSKNLIKVFYLNEEFKKLPWAAADIKPAQVNKCGIVGAGVMGGGIAQLVSFRDIPVRLKDINFDALKNALKTADGLFKYAVKKRKLTKAQADYKFGLISPTLADTGFKNADLVIEAVAEDLKVKQAVFKRLGQITGPGCALATNTSALPIIKIAEDTDAAERVVGLHFFNPVHKMPLIEVIRSAKTSQQALATAIAFARRLGKVAIVVKDVPGFLINRILLSYLNEAGFLLEEGMKIERIDRIARGFGMPMGPIELIDEVGIDVGCKVVEILQQAYGERMQACRILKKAKDKGLLGKKSRRGFYLHGKKKKTPNDDIYAFVEKGLKCAVGDETAEKRMCYVMINEAARCLREGVADRPETIDIGMIMGCGFPPFRGGLLRYADSAGIDNITEALGIFKKESGKERFTPCDYLLKKAEKKEGFYPSAKN